MIKRFLWFVAVIAAVPATVVGSYRLQSDLRSSFPYPANAAPHAAATSARLVERLRREPLQAAVLRELAVRQDAQFALLELSEKVSRRDPLTQLLLVEHTTDQGDIAGTLEHYAVLLTISPGMYQGILDLLGTAAREPQIFNALAVYKDEQWFPAVMRRMVAVTDTGEAVLHLIQGRPEVKETLTGPADIQQLFKLMINKPDPQHAFALVEPQCSSRPGFTCFGFSTATLDERLAPLTWKLTTHATALPADDERGVALRVKAVPNTRTDIAERFTNLSPGAYRLAGRVDVDKGSKLQLRWTAKCKGETTTGDIINHTVSLPQNEDRFEMPVTIPARCLVQYWQLAVLGDDARHVSILTIQEFRLDPAV